MITSTTTLVPDNPAAAYAAYRQAASAVFLAGTQGLKYKKDHYDLAVDLSKAGLTYIDERADEIVIGAMTPLWQIKISQAIQNFAGGAISKAISDVADKNIQRYGTLGGVISSKAPFSVLLPILLSLHVDVQLQDKGCMSLDDYLHCPPMGELVTGISIAKEAVYTAYKAYRKLPLHEPTLLGAVAMRD
uniref:FAD binding domain-containing protein n=1 Tax=Megasphaera elsdenii TaxID=907 RepID=UPI004025F782